MNASGPIRSFLTLVTLLAGSLASTVARADEAPPRVGAARPPPAPCWKRPSARRLETTATVLGATGAATLWFTWYTSFATAASIALDDSPAKSSLAPGPKGHRVTSNELGWVAVPVAGPFVAAAKIPKLDPRGPIDDAATRTVLKGDGIAQSVAVGMIGLAAVAGTAADRYACEGKYAPIAKNDGSGANDTNFIPLLLGGLALGLFHPISEYVAVTESHDKTRLWALLPGPGPIIAAATLHPKAIHDSGHPNDRFLYGLLGGTEMLGVGLLASTPLWKPLAKEHAPEVKVGAGSVALAWKF